MLNRANKVQMNPFIENLNEYSIVMWPKILVNYLNEMPNSEGIKSVKKLVWGIKTGLEEHPDAFPDFFKAYEKVSNLAQLKLNGESRKQLLLQDIAGFCFLADYDSKGFLTYEMMKGSSRLSESPFDYPNLYQNPGRYGPSMKELSKQIKISGLALKSFIFDRSPSC